MASRNNYRCISNFGPNTYSPINNPVSYSLGQTLENNFLHGASASMYSQFSPNSQAYMAEYCGNNWDGYCEYLSTNRNVSYPNTQQNWLDTNKNQCRGDRYELTAGENLIKNAAAEKYLVDMIGAVKKFQPYDPTVASSPMYGTWVPTGVTAPIPIYAISDPANIDNDILMDKLLERSYIAPAILVNIFNTMQRNGTLGQLKGTKLGNFYARTPMFIAKGAKNVL